MLELLEKDCSRVTNKYFQDSLVSVVKGSSRFNLIKNKNVASVLSGNRTKPVNPCEGRFAM